MIPLFAKFGSDFFNEVRAGSSEERLISKYMTSASGIKKLKHAFETNGTYAICRNKAGKYAVLDDNLVPIVTWIE